MILAILLIAGAYILGSVPFALVIGRGFYHVDVRKHGSGNIGTTNVFRVLGKTAGIIVFAGDFAKGFLPVFLALRLIEGDDGTVVAVLAAGAAIAGHTWPLFLRFRGGKGVATGGGAVTALMPLLFLAVFVIFWVVLLVGRMVSVASLTSVTALVVLAIATGQPLPYIIFTLAGAAVIFYAHRSNIRRLFRGEENKVNFPWKRGTGEANKAPRVNQGR